MAYNDWESVPGNNAGSFTGGGNKLVIHTTEGGSIAGAVSAYRKNNSWPHATISYEENRKVRHLPLNVAARSLANNTGDGYQTNRADCVQVEVVGKASEAGSWSKAKLDWIAAAFNEIRADYSFPLQYPEFKIGATRFTDSAFVAYEGIVGHEHAPDNDHWDPGALDVTYIVSKMGGTILPIQKEAVVTKEIAYTKYLALDDQGNGYIDLYHSEGKDPVSVQVSISGGIPLKNEKQGYPNIGNPKLLKAWYEGNTIRITCVGGVARKGFDVNVLAGW